MIFGRHLCAKTSMTVDVHESTPPARTVGRADRPTVRGGARPTRTLIPPLSGRPRTRSAELRKVHGEPAAAGERPTWITNAATILLRDTQHLGHVVLVVSKNNQKVLVLRSTSGGESWSPPIDVSATAVLKPWKCVQIELGVLLLV